MESGRVAETAMAHVDGETCTACGMCVAVCPMSIPHQVSGQAGQVEVELRPDRLPMCIRCGHFMAICPTQSIHIDGLCCAEHFFELPHGDLQVSSFLTSWPIVAPFACSRTPQCRERC